MSALRAEALMSPEVRPQQFAILVRDIPAAPKGQTVKEHVDSYFKSIYPDTFYRSMVVTDIKQVPLFIVLVSFVLNYVAVYCCLVFLDRIKYLDANRINVRKPKQLMCAANW